MQASDRYSSSPDNAATQRRRERRKSRSIVPACGTTDWPDQRLQFATRYFFALLGFIYFNWGFGHAGPWLDLQRMNGFLLAYLAWNTILLLHARQHPFSPWRVRIALWGDVIAVSLTVLNDPWILPLTSMVYIVIVLGNGMRYGMRCFTEAVAASFLAAMLTLSLRYHDSLQDVMPAVLFMNLFGAIILIYAHLLMARIEASRQRLMEESRHDPLTRLLNRAALEEETERLLAQAEREGMPLVVMFADLDRFKSVNDAHGHAEGDSVLRSVARILRASIRDTDLAGRYGGDEFVLVLQDLTLEEAERIGGRIQRRLQQWAKRRHYDVGISIGLGEIPRHGRNLQDLLDKVDEALYACKGRRDLSVVALG